MKRLFPGYYRPTPDEFSSLWDACLFVLDANVLLNCYRYSGGTRQKLMSVFEGIADRLWVPHQAALEYHKRRLDVISEQVDVYDRIEKLLQDERAALTGKLRSYSRHPLISVERIVKRVDSALNWSLRELRKWKSSHRDFSDEDPVRDKLTVLLDGKIGPAYPPERMRQIYALGKERYEQGIPPGYKDSQKKTDAERYGDLVLWFQVIDEAKKVKKPIVLVTDDGKDDWWMESRGRTIGPRPELVEELLKEAGMRFYMYRTDAFMRHAEKPLGLTGTDEAIHEVEAVRQQTEGVAEGQSGMPIGLLDQPKTGSLQATLGRYQYPQALQEFAAKTAIPSFNLGLEDLQKHLTLTDLQAKWVKHLPEIAIASLHLEPLKYLTDLEATQKYLTDFQAKWAKYMTEIPIPSPNLGLEGIQKHLAPGDAAPGTSRAAEKAVSEPPSEAENGEEVDGSPKSSGGGETGDDTKKI